MLCYNTPDPRKWPGLTPQPFLLNTSQPTTLPKLGRFIFCLVFRSFKDRTIQQLDTFEPFEYQTCPVFRCLLYITFIISTYVYIFGSLFQQPHKNFQLRVKSLLHTVFKWHPNIWCFRHHFSVTLCKMVPKFWNHLHSPIKMVAIWKPNIHEPYIFTLSITD